MHPKGVKALIMRHLKTDLKFLKKNLALPVSSRDAHRYFGGTRFLTDRLVDQVLDDLMAKEIRQTEAFHALEAQLERDGIARQGQDKRLTKHLEKIDGMV